MFDQLIKEARLLSSAVCATVSAAIGTTVSSAIGTAVSTAIGTAVSAAIGTTVSAAISGSGFFDRLFVSSGVSSFFSRAASCSGQSEAASDSEHRCKVGLLHWFSSPKMGPWVGWTRKFIGFLSDCVPNRGKNVAKLTESLRKANPILYVS
ncbi:MAG: hypothetical protein AAF687_13795 [Pseudomonadota bacterium]